ncbi:MAG: ATP synthase F1 subunit delta [Oscillospiraceae bacterium]|nr:ATP synthase F1 subunit delta [Oscillospiraceae bacterium]
MRQTVGRVYAEALFSLAQESGCEARIHEELDTFDDLTGQYPELAVLLDVPTLSAPERVEVLRRIIGDTQGITENFLCLLTERRRFSHLSEIRRSFDAMYDEHFGIAEVEVTSAVALTDAQRKALCETLGRKLSRKIRLHEQVDASLIGGMIVQYGDTRMDNSLRGQLSQFARESKSE